MVQVAPVERTSLLAAAEPFTLDQADTTPLLHWVAPAAIVVLNACTSATSSVPAPSLESALLVIAEHMPITYASVAEATDLLPFCTIAARPRTTNALDPWVRAPAAASSTSQQAARRALAAVRNLCDWLEVPEDQVAQMAGFSRRSLPNWRAGGGVYPKTVRRLFELHALVHGLVDRLGRTGANAWLAQRSAASGASMTRRELLATGPDGVRAVLDEAQPLLFAAVNRRVGAAEFEEATTDSAFTAAPHRRAFTEPRPPRRPRQDDH